METIESINAKIEERRLAVEAELKKLEAERDSLDADGKALKAAQEAAARHGMKLIIQSPEPPAQPPAPVLQQPPTPPEPPTPKPRRRKARNKTLAVSNHSYGQKVEDHVFILLGADFAEGPILPQPAFRFTGKPPFSTAKERPRAGHERTVVVDVASDMLHLAPAMCLYFFTLFSRLHEHGIAIVSFDATRGRFELTDRAVQAIRSANLDHIAAIAALYRNIFTQDPVNFPVRFKNVDQARNMALNTMINMRGVRAAQQRLGVPVLNGDQYIAQEARRMQERAQAAIPNPAQCPAIGA